MSKEIDENLFEQIFDHQFETLANKLINTTNKKENQIIADIIKKSKYKLYENNKYDNFLIQSQQRTDLAYVINFILNFNEKSNYENENGNEDNENENQNEDNENENENEENEKLRKEYENEKNEKKEIIKRLNDDLDEITDQSKSFQDQTKSIRKVKNLNEYYHMHNYDNKELKL